MPFTVYGSFSGVPLTIARNAGFFDTAESLGIVPSENVFEFPTKSILQPFRSSSEENCHSFSYAP